jgi:hypothetical protein
MFMASACNTLSNFSRGGKTLMIQTNIMRLIVIGGLLTGASSPLFSHDALWDQTVAFIKATDRYLPGSIQSHQQILDEKGEKQHDSAISIKLGRHNGSLSGSVEAFYEDGVEKTQSLREEIEQELAKDISENLLDFVWDIPFSMDNIAQLKVSKSSERRTVGTIECEGYLFESVFFDSSIPDTPLTFRGTVWVDPATAVPARIESVLLDSSIKVDGARIMGLTREVDFCYTDNQWRMVHKRQEMWLKARFLLKKFLVMVSHEVDLTDHFKYEIAKN